MWLEQIKKTSISKTEKIKSPVLDAIKKKKNPLSVMENNLENSLKYTAEVVPRNGIIEQENYPDYEYENGVLTKEGAEGFAENWSDYDEFWVIAYNQWLTDGIRECIRIIKNDKQIENSDTSPSINEEFDVACVFDTLIWKRFRTEKEIWEYIAKELRIDLIPASEENATKSVAWVGIPEMESLYDGKYDDWEKDELPDNHLLSTVTIAKEGVKEINDSWDIKVFLDIDIYFIKDNANNFYITEYNFESQ